MAVTFFKVVALLFLIYINSSMAAASWCVARSDASDQALQTALDFACAAGADCAPLQSSGLCYLPNTVQAHASYAFNSYYHRTGNAPGACSFSGTATIAGTDPSYGSCVYPSSPSTAGGMVVPPGPGGTTPAISQLPPPAGMNNTPLYGSTNPPDTPRSDASPKNIIFSPVFFMLLFWLYTMNI